MNNWNIGVKSFTRYDDKSIIDAHLPQECKCCGEIIQPCDLIFVNTEYQFMHAFCSMDCACISCGFHSLADMTKIRRLSPDMSKYWMYFKCKPERCHCKECEEKRKLEKERNQ